jgi:putative flippase GtrA
MIKKTFIGLQYLYKHHFIRYLFVGGTTFMIDFALLYLLHSKAHIELAIATSSGYWISIVYNFFLNRTWTFSAVEKTNLRKNLSTYLVLLGCNYIFTVVFISILSHSINYLLAKVLAVAIQMTWTYYIYKNYVFVKKEPQNTSANKKAATSKA